MKIPERSRFIGDEDALQIWWSVSGSLVNFASGYTFTLKVASIADPATVLFTKTTGFTGAAGSGVEGNGTPNLTVTFATSGELNSITDDGTYLLEIVAQKTSDSTQTTYLMRLKLGTRLG